MKSLALAILVSLLAACMTGCRPALADFLDGGDEYLIARDKKAWKTAVNERDVSGKAYLLLSEALRAIGSSDDLEIMEATTSASGESLVFTTFRLHSNNRFITAEDSYFVWISSDGTAVSQTPAWPPPLEQTPRVDSGGVMLPELEATNAGGRRMSFGAPPQPEAPTTILELQLKGRWQPATPAGAAANPVTITIADRSGTVAFPQGSTPRQVLGSPYGAAAIVRTDHDVFVVDMTTAAITGRISYSSASDFVSAWVSRDVLLWYAADPASETTERQSTVTTARRIGGDKVWQITQTSIPYHDSIVLSPSGRWFFTDVAGEPYHWIGPGNHYAVARSGDEAQFGKPKLKPISYSRPIWLKK